MPYEHPSYLAGLRTTDLVPLLTQALGDPAVEVLTWEVAPMGGGSAQYVEGGLGVHRIAGTARSGTSVVPWSLIAKGASATAGTGSNDPAHPFYWKREVLIYQSGLLANLPGQLKAPRCYAILEPSPDEVWLWLEEVQEPTRSWPLERYRLAAQHLGQFNGAYLAGVPLPKPQSWHTHGRIRPKLVEREFAFLPSGLAETPFSRRLLLASLQERVGQLWSRRHDLLQALDQLPVCFCHHDAFRRNLFAGTAAETVATDWSYAGFGGVGEEIGTLTQISLNWLEVPAAQAKELDQIVFEGYLAGVYEAGWHGDHRLVRFGYATTVALGITWLLFMIESLQNAENISLFESVIGHPIDDQIAQVVELQSFFLDLGDEALVLADTL